MEHVHVILCDFDYTLADSSEGVIECVNAALESTGYPPAHPQSVRRMIGASLDETFRSFLPDIDLKTLSCCKTIFLEKAESGLMVESTYMLEGVIDTLESLFDNVYTLGVVSTKRRSTIEKILNRHGLEELFEAVVGSEDVRQTKPHPESLLNAMTQLEATPEETVYVGDHIYDIQAAKAAGLRVIAVASGPTSKADLVAAGPNHLIDRFSELQKVFNLV